MKVVREVRMVRDRVALMARFITLATSPRFVRSVSRIRSKTTMVSLME